MKSILIAGASGFVGKQLSLFFLNNGYRVTGIGTSTTHIYQQQYPHFQWISADTTSPGQWQDHVSQSDVVVNLTGKTIFRYWTKKYKEEIYNTRILTTQNIVHALEEDKNKLFITTSAAGIYGDRNDEQLNEECKPGKGFLAEVCIDWEKEGLKAESKGVRVAIMRLGVVLGDGGALASMIPAFKMGVGGPLGGGQQWFPWIHIEDIQKAIYFIVKEKALNGIFNFTAPGQVRQKQFASALGKIMHRPAFIPAPGFMIRLIMGQMGAALMQSQRAIPEKLLDSGFNYKYPQLDQALRPILG